MKLYAPILSLYEQAAQAGLLEIAEQTLVRAKELSPTITGESDDSGFMLVEDLIAQVGFTSFVSLLQHEKLEFRHPNGGEPKFLETAAAEIEPDVERIMAAKLRAVTGG